MDDIRLKQVAQKYEELALYWNEHGHKGHLKEMGPGRLISATLAQHVLPDDAKEDPLVFNRLFHYVQKEMEKHIDNLYNAGRQDDPKQCAQVISASINNLPPYTSQDYQKDISDFAAKMQEMVVYKLTAEEWAIILENRSRRLTEVYAPDIYIRVKKFLSQWAADFGEDELVRKYILQNVIRILSS